MNLIHISDMAQNLQLATRPSIGQAVFVSPHMQAPWGGRKGEVLRVIKSDITVSFPGGVYESFPLPVIFELIEED